MDLQIARNLGQMFESATRSLNIPFDGSSVNVSLPSSVTSFINTKYYNVETSFSRKDIVKGLESGNDAEIYTALKHLVCKLALVKEPSSTDIVIANSSGNYDEDDDEMMADINDNSTVKEIVQLFPHIVKNVNSTNLKIKRLVYILLLRFNHLQQDISLLSINAIQKSLVDKNAFNRSLAIRCLSGIQIPAILPILLLSLTKLIKDSSPLVRSACAIAIIKCVQLDIQYNLDKKGIKKGTSFTNKKKKLAKLERSYLIDNLNTDGSNIQQLYLMLDTLLSDNDPKVLSVAVIAYYEVFNGCFDTWHNKVTNLVNHFPQLDSFAIVCFLDIMTEYTKLFYPPFDNIQSTPIDINLLYDHINEMVDFEMDCNVVLSMVRFLVVLFPFEIEKTNRLNKIMIKMIQRDYNDSIDNDEKIIIALSMIQYLLSKELIQFKDYQIHNFIPMSNDNAQIFQLKINILFKLINVDNFNMIFKELKFIIEKSQFPTILKFQVLQIINKLILLNILTIEQFSQIIRFFMNKLTTETDDVLVGEYITGLRQLIQSNLSYYIDILIKLTGKLYNSYTDTGKHLLLVNNAKSSIIWLLGEFAINYNNESEINNDKCTILKDMIPHIGFKLVENFKNETDHKVRYEILIFCTKMMIIDILNNDKDNYQLFNNEKFQLFNYLLQLTKYDTDLNIRDTSRLIGSIIPNVVYFSDLNLKERIDIDQLLQSDSVLLQHCTEKCTNINIAVLMFQITKPQLSMDSKIDELELLRNIDPTLVSFVKSTSCKLDIGYTDYYNDLRSNGFQLHDYSKYNSSFSSSSTTSPQITTPKERSPVPASAARKNSVSKYRLQSLDDFLGS